MLHFEEVNWNWNISGRFETLFKNCLGHESGGLGDTGSDKSCLLDIHLSHLPRGKHTYLHSEHLFRSKPTVPTEKFLCLKGQGHDIRMG